MTQPPNLSEKALGKLPYEFSTEEKAAYYNLKDPLAIPTKETKTKHAAPKPKPPVQDLTLDRRPKLYNASDYDNSDPTKDDSPLKLLAKRINILEPNPNQKFHNPVQKPIDNPEDDPMGRYSLSPEEPKKGSCSTQVHKKQKMNSALETNETGLPDDLLSKPTLNPRNLYNNIDINAMPNSLHKILKEIAGKHAKIYSGIINDQLTIEEHQEHLRNETTPEYIIKQHKKTINKEEDRLIKAEFLQSKINQAIAKKINLLAEKVIIFRSRQEEIKIATETARNLFNFAQDDETTLTQFYGYVDWLTSDKLVDFNRTQQKNKLKKEQKKAKFDKKKEEDEIPAVVTAKELNKLKEQIENLKKTKTTKKKTTKKEDKNKSPTKNKKKTAAKKQDFQKGKQNKSRSAPPTKGKKQEKKKGGKN